MPFNKETKRKNERKNRGFWYKQYEYTVRLSEWNLALENMQIMKNRKREWAEEIELPNQGWIRMLEENDNNNNNNKRILEADTIRQM